MRHSTFRLLPSLHLYSEALTAADDGGRSGLPDGRGNFDRRGAPGDAFWVTMILLFGRRCLCAAALCGGLRVFGVCANHVEPQGVVACSGAAYRQCAAMRGWREHRYALCGM